MKKLLFAGVAALVLAAAVTTPAAAEDRLALSGSVRVRGFFGDTVEYGSKSEFFDQRLRLGGKLTAADGVFVNFRFDAAESAWGSNPPDGKDTNRVKSLQWDKANLELDQKSFNLVAGQQYFGFGNSIAIDHIGAGITATIKGSVPVTLLYTKLNEGAGLTDRKDNGSVDADLYGASIAHQGENYQASLFFARLQDRDGDYLNTDGDLSIVGFPFIFSSAHVNALGLTYDGSIDKLQLKFEGNYFFGSAAEFGTGNSIDTDGLQLYGDVAVPVSDQVKLGLMGFYAQAANNASNKAQFTQLSDWQDWDPSTFGHRNLDFSILPSGDYEIFDFTGNDAGVIGAQVYASFDLTKDLNLMTSAYYLVPEDDNLNGNTVDSTLGGNLSVNYALLANTSLSAQGAYNTSKMSGATPDLDQYMIITQLEVSF